MTVVFCNISLSMIQSTNSSKRNENVKVQMFDCICELRAKREPPGIYQFYCCTLLIFKILFNHLLISHSSAMQVKFFLPPWKKETKWYNELKRHRGSPHQCPPSEHDLINLYMVVKMASSSLLVNESFISFTSVLHILVLLLFTKQFYFFLFFHQLGLHFPCESCAAGKRILCLALG